MAARKNTPRLSNEWRERIKSGLILSRLEQAALGEIEMTPSALKAAEIVLRKTLPDLARTEVTGDEGGPQELVIRWKEPT
jgi:hypothetical protein